VVGDRRLVVFADYVCPFCYLAENVLQRLRAEGTMVEPAAFELRPPGTPLPSPDEPWLREGWRRSVEPLARELGVTMQYPALSTRTRKAHEAVAFAGGNGVMLEMHQAVYQAYWQDGRDIGRIDVLVEIGADVGLDRGALRVALDIDQWTERVRQDGERAARLALGGVPAYVLAGGSNVPAGNDRTAAPADGAADEANTDVAQRVRIGLLRYDELRAWMADHDV
jgi:predicted DsbA family dithiol-disulfide isomerase